MRTNDIELGMCDVQLGSELGRVCFRLFDGKIAEERRI